MIKKNLKLRSFEFLVSYGGVVWLPQRKTGDASIAINATPVSSCSTHTTRCYEARIKNDLSFNLFCLLRFHIYKLKTPKPNLMKLFRFCLAEKSKESKSSISNLQRRHVSKICMREVQGYL